jgi:ribosome maturation factor RimP
LFTLAHYRQFTGCTAQVNLFAPQDGRRKFSGPILGADENGVRIEQDGKDVTLDFNNIAKARLVPDYEKILAGHKSK